MPGATSGVPTLWALVAGGWPRQGRWLHRGVPGSPIGAGTQGWRSATRQCSSRPRPSGCRWTGCPVSSQPNTLSASFAARPPCRAKLPVPRQLQGDPGKQPARTATTPALQGVAQGGLRATGQGGGPRWQWPRTSARPTSRGSSRSPEGRESHPWCAWTGPQVVLPGDHHCQPLLHDWPRPGTPQLCDWDHMQWNLYAGPRAAGAIARPVLPRPLSPSHLAPVPRSLQGMPHLCRGAARGCREEGLLWDPDAAPSCGDHQFLHPMVSTGSRERVCNVLDHCRPPHPTLMLWRKTGRPICTRWQPWTIAPPATTSWRWEPSLWRQSRRVTCPRQAEKSQDAKRPPT